MIGGDDPQEIVLDEIAVLPIVYLASGLTNWRLFGLGWVLFRLFDITKPLPARNLEKLPGGWGVIADDAAAACYACLALWIHPGPRPNLRLGPAHSRRGGLNYSRAILSRSGCHCWLVQQRISAT